MKSNFYYPLPRIECIRGKFSKLEYIARFTTVRIEEASHSIVTIGKTRSNNSRPKNKLPKGSEAGNSPADPYVCLN